MPFSIDQGIDQGPDQTEGAAQGPVVPAQHLLLTLSVSAGSQAVLVRSRTLRRTLSAPSATAGLVRAVKARVLLLSCQQGTLGVVRPVRRLQRVITATQTTVLAVTRGFRRTLTVSQKPAPAFTRSFGQTLTAVAGYAAWSAAPGLAILLADPFETIRLFLLSLLTLRPKMLTPAKLLFILDIFGRSYRTADLQATATQLTGVGAQIYGDGTTILGTGNEAFILKMASGADAMVAASQPDVVNRGIYGLVFTPLNSFLSSQGGANYSNLDTYLTSLNAGAAYTALVSPNTAYLQWLYNSKQPTLLMQPANVYAPKTAMGTVAVGAGAALTWTPGASIPTTNDGVNGVQGYAPAPGLTALVTAAINGTLAVALTVSGWNAQGQPVAGRTWTAQLDNLAAGQSAAFVPSAAGDRLSQITAIAGQGSASGGAFSLQTTTDRSAP